MRCPFDRGEELMIGPNTQALLDQLRQIEAAAVSGPDLDAVDGHYQRLLSNVPGAIPLLVAHNQFRLRHGPRLRHRRPKVLIGYVNDSHFPNFHTIPLLRVADVVSLTTRHDAAPGIDRVHYDPSADRLGDTLGRLPEGFLPDLFWDNQVEHGHIIPLGLEDVPFPTAAGLCHMFLAPSLAHVSRLFDVVVPLSKAYIPRVQAMTDGAVIDVPFGANWASFDEFVAPVWEKSVDVALTFAEVPPGVVYGDARNRLWAAMRTFERKYGDRYSVVMQSGLDKGAYVRLLQSARIVVNAGSVNGPYNYRTCESMNAGALLLQHDGRGLAFETRIEEYFRDGEHLVTFNFDTLEQKLLHYLEHPEAASAIARAGHAFLTTAYRYESIYRRLFREVQQAGRRRLRPAPLRADFDVAMTYYHQFDYPFPGHAIVGLPYVLEQPHRIRNNNLMVLIPQLLQTCDSQTVLGHLAALPEIGAAFAESSWNGIRALRAATPGDPVVTWNYAMLAVERGHATTNDIERAMSALESIEMGDFPFDPAEMLIHEKVRCPGIDVAEVAETLLRELAVPLLTSSGMAADVRGVYVRFMRAQCELALRAVETAR
jgi:glycosyltransferase involved in cell wall biosynthesis